MAVIRSEISVKSPYYISKHRYLELKHFCLQYPEWRVEVNKLNYFGSMGDGIRGSDPSKPVERLAGRRERYLKYMEMVEQSCLAADPDIFEWLLKAVTMGLSYDTLSTLEIPCGRGYFYERYRKFFWCLDRVRE